MLGAIAEEEEEEEVGQHPPPPPPPPIRVFEKYVIVAQGRRTPTPPPMAMKKGHVPPPPPSRRKMQAGNIKKNSPRSSKEGQSSPPAVPVSKIRRATQIFMDDPTMKKLSEGLNSSPGKKEQTKKKSIATKLKEKREEDDMQMLRGIFAAFDDNKNGRLSKRELGDALIALGFSPTEALMHKFYTENLNQTGKKSWQISLPAFVTAALKHLDSAKDCKKMYVFVQGL